jgi:hypothetical protein
LSGDSGNWKHFNFDSLRAQAMEMYDAHNRSGVRISPVMAQDSLEYWIAVAAWRAAMESVKTPMGSTRWR